GSAREVQQILVAEKAPQRHPALPDSLRRAFRLAFFRPLTSKREEEYSMPTADAVLRLNDELAGRKVLSVYLNAEETDPALRRTWRVRLNSMLKALEEERSTAPREERKELAQAIQRIEEALDEYGGQLPQRGWIGFATADALHYASPLVTPM